MPLSKITDVEFKVMDAHRKGCSISEDAESKNDNYISSKQLLSEWARVKGSHLYKMFGEELTLKKRISYEKSYEELEEEIDEMSRYSYMVDSKGKRKRSGYDFLTELSNMLWVYKTTTPELLEVRDEISSLMYTDTLISNRYEGEAFEIPYPDNPKKKYRVLPGSKVSKTLGKIAKMYDIKGYEDFRICHSQVLNQKQLSGELTISIHPLDYMTMSDNDCGWDTCMSWWASNGCHRQGTVEMMNSPTVIVAYLASDEPMSICPYNCDEEVSGFKWSNKKWRQLFVVDRNVIIAVKDYPYHNNDLSKVVVEWLKELAETRLGWKYQELEEYHSSFVRQYDNNKKVYLDFPVNNMYSDFGCQDFHWMCLAEDFDERNKDNGNEFYYGTNVYIPYSGKPQCMICGELDGYFEDESCLACESCQNRCVCDFCGENHGEFVIDDVYLCEYCYDHNVYTCEFCEEEHLAENLNTIRFIPRYTKEEMMKIKQTYLDSYFNAERYIENCHYTEFIKHDEYLNISLCDKCLDDWVKENLKEGTTYHKRRFDVGHFDLAVYIDDLKEPENYVYDYKNMEQYKETLKDSRVTPTAFYDEI